VSSIYRISNGVPADEVPGEEVFISTIFAPGTTLIRSYSDPINTVSTPNSTIQYYAPWTELPQQQQISTFDDVTVLGTGVALPGNYSRIEGADDQLFQFATYDTTSTLLASFQVGYVAGQNQSYSQFPLQIDNTFLASTVTTNAVIIQDENSGSNNTMYYDTADDRLKVIDSVPTTHTIAYTDDSPIFWSGWSSTTQSSITTDVAVPITHDDEYYNQGGFTFNVSTIIVPQDGFYNITPSIQFDNPGGSGTRFVSFWVRKNGVNIDKSASRESVAANEQILGTVSIIEFANAGDGFEICFATNSANQMNITSFADSVDVPVTPPLSQTFSRCDDRSPHKIVE
jgi:hypothetical protein